MIRKIKTTIALLLSVFLFAGCGSNKYKIPELKEPVVTNETYQCAVRGNVGKVVYKQGTIEPVKHAQFWKTSVAIKEVKVRVGDKVKKGDVLAVADVEYVTENIAAINREIAYLNEQKAVEDEKYEMQMAEYQYRLDGAKEIGNTSVAKQTEDAMKVAEENKFYSDLLYNHRIKYKNDELSDLAEVVENENLLATYDGVVTYSLDLTKANIVNKECNVAVITDYNETFLSVPYDVNANESNYSDVYAIVGGKRCEIKEIEYSANEKAVLKSKSVNMPNRYEFVDKQIKPELGTTIYIACRKEYVDDTIIVNNESVYSDDKGDFVYIINGDKNEKRYIETGMHDAHNTEVKSGIEEGEKVFLKNNTTLPEEYTELLIERKDFEFVKESGGIIINKYNCVIRSSDVAGIVKNGEADGYKCEAGDTLCKIETSEGAASLLQQRVQMQEAEQDHQAYVDTLNEQMEALQLKINEETFRREHPAVYFEDDMNKATRSDAFDDFEKRYSFDIPEEDKGEFPIEEFNGLYYLEELNCQMEQLKLELELSNVNFEYQLGEMRYNYEKQCENNDGSGMVEVKAKANGILKKRYVSDGDEVQNGTKLFVFGYEVKPLIEFTRTGVLHSEVNFYMANDLKYSGTVIAYNAQDENYLTTIDGVVYVTSGAYKDGYISVDCDEQIAEDPSVGKLKCKVCVNSIKDALVVPTRAIQSEVNTLGDEYKYVWVSKDGVISKRYVEAQDFEGNSVIIDGLEDGETIMYEG